MLRFFFWLLVVSGTTSILRGIVAHMGLGPDDARGGMDRLGDEVAQRLLRDPICGMHVAEGLAVPLREGWEILYFCSAACRDKYLSGTKRFAANG